MTNSISLLGMQLKEIWSHFGINQKVSTILALLLVIGITAGILTWSSAPSYSLLYSGMALEDAASAREKLTEERIPVQVRDSGHSLYVGARDVYRSRLLLASQGLPKKSSSGFELFEEPKFGLTDFAQKVNYQRALQGELERTISTMDGIESARVIVVLPSDRLFASESEKKATASIMLNVGAGGIEQAQVRSIKQLVGCSVPGLSPSAITVSDQQGRLLSKSQDDEGLETGVASDQMEVQQKCEKLLAMKAQNLLDTALGKGRSVVQVSVLMDFSKIDKKKETLDVAGRVIVSEQIKSESSSSPNGTAASGVVATVPVGNPSALSTGQSDSKTKSEDINTQYQVPSAMEHVVESGARVKSISVSVAVAAGDTPRTPADVTQIEELVKSALGLVTSADRTDSIKVAEMEFVETAAVSRAPSILDRLPVAPGVIVNGVGGVLLLIVIVVMSRRISSRLSVTSEETGMQVASLAAGQAAAAGGFQAGGMGDEVPVNTLDYLTRLAEHNPKAIATWINTVSRAHR
jgi:flagellar M-ring protein FliF